MTIFLLAFAGAFCALVVFAALFIWFMQPDKIEHPIDFS